MPVCLKFGEEDLDLDDGAALYKARNNVSMHAARYSFAVFALNKGLSMSVVSRLLGHSSTDVTGKVYPRFLPETLSNEVARLTDDFASLEIV